MVPGLSSDVACRVSVNTYRIAINPRRIAVNTYRLVHDLINRYDLYPQGAKQCNLTDFNAH